MEANKTNTTNANNHKTRRARNYANNIRKQSNNNKNLNSNKNTSTNKTTTKTQNKVVKQTTNVEDKINVVPKVEKEVKQTKQVTRQKTSQKAIQPKVEKTITREELPKVRQEVKEELPKVIQKPKVEERPIKKEIDKKLLEEIDKEIEKHKEEIKKEVKVETKPQPNEQPKATSKTEVAKPKKKKRKLKVYNLFCIILMLITIIASVVLVLNVDKLGILPTKYFAIVIGGMIFVNLLVLLLISRKFKFFRFIGILLSILLITISSIGSTYIKETNNFLDNNFNNIDVEVSSYKVLTLASSTLTSEKDLTGKKVGYLFETIKELEEFKTQTNCELVEYRDLYSLYEDLLNKKLEAVLVDDAFIGILLDDYQDIETKTKAIYTYNVETPIEENKDTEKDEELKPEELVRPINIYISGSDSRSQNLSVNTRSDVNMIVSINPYTHEILLTSIPRDYYVQVHGKTGLKDKLTHAGIYGMNTSAKTVGDLFDIEMDYSVKVGMNAVVEVVDLVGGIEVYSDITFNSFHMPGWVVKKGMNKMNGKKALAYARERYAYASGDRHRIKNQQQVLEAVLKKAMTDKSLLLKYDKLLASLGKFYRTDIPADVIKAFMQEQLETMPTWTFTTQTVDGKGASLPTYTAPNYKRYVMIPYEDDVRKASINIKSLISRK